MRRGDVVELRIPRGTRGHEQQGRRFGVILQADELVTLSTVLIAPTSTSALPATFRPQIVVAGRSTRVLVEQLGAVDPSRLGRSIRRLDAAELADIDDALRLVLGLW